MGDHTETFEVDFDPTKITYKQLLGLFWSNHNPSARPYSMQYKAAVFYHNDSQKQLAEDTAKKIADKSGKTIRTEILSATEFYLAEDYHQKYYLKQHTEFVKDLLKSLKSEKALTDSTAAARINGYVGGYGTKEQLNKEIESLGLSEKGKVILRQIVR